MLLLRKPYFHGNKNIHKYFVFFSQVKFIFGTLGKRKSILPSPTPIFEAEFCAALAGIFYHLPFSNFIRLVGDNLGVLFVLRKGSCRNSTGNFFLQNLAKIYLQSRFLLNLR